MNDKQLRNAVKRKVLGHALRDPKTVVLEEFALRHGAARIDIAVINSGIHGIELKSDRDTLKRLPDQIQAYNSIFDNITLIVSYRHAYEALELVPGWWGVKLAHTGPRGAIHIADARRPRNNPSADIQAIAALLWRAEALEFLSEIDTTHGFRSKPRAAIYARIAELSDITTVRSKVRQQLTSRKDWRSAAIRMSNGD